jgi:hypothetical protein
MDWTDNLTPEQRATWEEWVENVRRAAVEQIAGSAAFVTIAPRPENVDVKYAVELGLAIMYEKPIIVLAGPGRPVPEKLRLLADRIVYEDIDTEEGRRNFADAIAEFVE